MSLCEAVLDIARQMEEEGEDLKSEGAHGAFLRSSLRGWARQLRTAVTASGGDAPPPLRSPLPPEIQNFTAIEEERRKIREARRRDAVTGDLDRAEEGERMVGIGDSDTLVRIPNDMPVGARCPVGEKWFKLGADGRLHADEGSTEEARKAQKIIAGRG